MLARPIDLAFALVLFAAAACGGDDTGSGSVGDGAAGASGTGGGDGGGSCGHVTCPSGQVCCNRLMSICTMPDEVCIQ